MQGVQKSAPSSLIVFPTHFSQLSISEDLYVPAKQGSEIVDGLMALNTRFLGLSQS